MIIEIAAFAALMSGDSRTAMTAHAARVIPTVYEAGHFYAVPRTTAGQKLRLIVDTGGGGAAGMYWISEPAASRLGLKTRTCAMGNNSVSVASLPRYMPDHGLPAPLASRSPCGKTLIVQGKHYADGDGQLGAGYLPGRVWTFDYPGQQLTVEGSSWRSDPEAHAEALGFQRNHTGRMSSGFARITIRVDGQAIDMLLDTGATAFPTKAGEKAGKTPTVHGEGVTSYIVHGVFERWHKQHPDWRVVENADKLPGTHHAMRIIEVPKVHIAGWSVGPVWFTERPDASFHQFMAKWMDRKPDGAVGGNVFRHFVMTLDYPHATAYFHCVERCKAVKPTSH